MGMNTIIIEGSDKALAAGGWAQTNIKHKWDISLDSVPFSNSYVFKFSNATDATLFALKWR
jgi:hypothetical protein